MSYRRRAPTHNSSTEHVRGPNSALTAFLREHGINDELIRRRQQLSEEADADHLSDLDENRSGEESQSPKEVAEEKEEDDEDEIQIRIAARRKRRLAKENNSDYTDSDEDIGVSGDNNSSDKSAKDMILGPGQETTCFDCDDSFIITAFSRKVKSEEGLVVGYLCKDCAKVLLEQEKAKRQKNLQARKKRKRLAEALLDRQELKFPSLQDICIKLIIQNIENVDKFGDIGEINLAKICKILCRNRMLSDESLPLFLNSNLKELELWDCSKLSRDALKNIAAFCPNLSHLKLQYAARMDDSILDYYSDKFSYLTSVDFNGSFLMNNDSWDKFLTKFGPNLHSFRLKNSNRFGDKAVLSLLDNCRSLKSFSLSRLDAIIDKSTYHLLANLPKTLKSLEISYPTNEILIGNDTILEILENIGANLETLNLDGCSGLNDEFLTVGIKQYCPELRNLSLKYLDQITDEGFAALFHEWSSNSGLFFVDLQKCVLLGDQSIQNLISHSSGSLLELNINSVAITTETIRFLESQSLPLLTTLDCGFVRCIDNNALQVLSKVCPKLKIIEVFGNNRCNGSANYRRGLQIIGRQSDSI